jgi:hypothetical protein
LSSDFPTTLSGYDQVLGKSDPERPIIGELEPEPYMVAIAAIHIAREVGALWILPGAFYDLASNDDATIHQILNCVAHNTSPANLSGNDQILFLKTTLQFSRQENFIMRFLHSRDIIAGCEGSKKCARARVHAMAKVHDHIEKSAPLGPDPLNLCRNAKIWKLLSDACDNCDRSFRTAHKEDRQALWDKLPEFCGLPPWPELEEMKAAALKA